MYYSYDLHSDYYHLLPYLSALPASAPICISLVPWDKSFWTLVRLHSAVEYFALFFSYKYFLLTQFHFTPETQDLTLWQLDQADQA